jgi:hypothetical protein
MSRLITFVETDRDDCEGQILLVEDERVGRAMAEMSEVSLRDYQHRLGLWRDGIPMPASWPDEYEQAMDVVEGLLKEYVADRGRPKTDITMVRASLLALEEQRITWGNQR